MGDVMSSPIVRERNDQRGSFRGLKADKLSASILALCQEIVREETAARRERKALRQSHQQQVTRVNDEPASESAHGEHDTRLLEAMNND